MEQYKLSVEEWSIWFDDIERSTLRVALYQDMKPDTSLEILNPSGEIVDQLIKRRKSA